eukprot:6180000-Lingulodinium_polyedra.AAC.1
MADSLHVPDANCAEDRAYLPATPFHWQWCRCDLCNITVAGPTQLLEHSLGSQYLAQSERRLSLRAAHCSHDSLLELHDTPALQHSQ